MQQKISIVELYGTNVFNDAQMREHLPKKIYTELQHTIEEGAELNASVAEVVANAMKDWAMERGATHFTHWFQPMTGITAEKHDSFLTVNNGKAITEFSGKELIKGESDASSFPSGGLRATFEARGYTAWDCTSPAFLREDSAGVTLCIPTAFCSYTGEALDKKTPLLRSVEAINKQALRILRLFGNTTSKKINIYAGAEQEYFLIDRELYKQRKDLIFTGRTLFGAAPPKGQELDDHYFGSIKERIAKFMKELNVELWKMGVSTKTKHNEVAPCQHEMAPIFTTTNIATDQNQLTMEMMKKVADRHNLVCLLHEKPFEGVNGSGKHNNWSLSTNTGENLLEPGSTPSSNAQFLLFLTAVIKGVDEYQDLLRISVASAGNDHRLGANEAPPAIVSMFVGDELYAILNAIESGTNYTDVKKTMMSVGVSTLPRIPKDNTDRNRTSPFAFTGNKFEFRMLGSTFNIACTNVMLNTIVAEELCQFADELEKAGDFDTALMLLIQREVKAHKRIIFNGNGYDAKWVEEAEKRGLMNLKTTPDALPHYTDEKNLKLFTKHKIYTEVEIASRKEILLEEYSKTINIEALTMIDMLKKNIIPDCIAYNKKLVDAATAKKNIGISADLEIKQADDISEKTTLLAQKEQELEKALECVPNLEECEKAAKYYGSVVIEKMKETRAIADELEMMVAEKYWSIPTYGKILYYV